MRFYIEVHCNDNYYIGHRINNRGMVMRDAVDMNNLKGVEAYFVDTARQFRIKATLKVWEDYKSFNYSEFVEEYKNGI